MEFRWANQKKPLLPDVDITISDDSNTFKNRTCGYCNNKVKYFITYRIFDNSYDNVTGARHLSCEKHRYKLEQSLLEYYLEKG